jgi:hypothetical protein
MSDEKKSADDLVDDLLKDIPLSESIHIKLPSGRMVTMKPITFEEEKLMLRGGKGNEDIISMLLSKCLTDVEDLGELLVIDKVFCLFKLREISFGDAYKFIIGCPSCGSEKHYNIEISKLPVTYLEDEEMEVVLPITKKKISLRPACVKDEDYITDSDKLCDNLWRFVNKIEDITRKDVFAKFIKRLPAGDITKIISVVSNADYGITNEVRIQCDSCGFDGPITLPLTRDFFTAS